MSNPFAMNVLHESKSGMTAKVTEKNVPQVRRKFVS